MSVQAEKRMAEIEQILEDFDERAGGLVAVSLLMKSGLPVAARIRAHVDETFLSASLASMLGIAVDLTGRLFDKTPARVMLDTDAGSLILRGVGEDMVLVAVFKKQHLGAMLLLVEHTTTKLSALFQTR